MEMALNLPVPVPTKTRLLFRRQNYRLCSRVSSAAPLVFASSFGCNAKVIQGRCSFTRGQVSHLLRNSTCNVSSNQVGLEDDVDDEACELVNGAELILGDGVDTFRAYLFKAVKNNNGTGILLLSDVHGFETPSTRDFAYRVACNGYNVLVPDLFRGGPWNKSRPRSEFDDWVAKQPFERVTKDINTSAKWMIDQFEAAGIDKKLGMIGFCFGGGCLIQALAQDLGTYFSTAVCFYGTNIDFSLADNITTPVLFITGDNDPLCTVNDMRKLEKSIKGSSVVVYKDQGHAFVHRPGSAEEDSDAEQAFVVMRNWLNDGLGITKA